MLRIPAMMNSVTNDRWMIHMQADDLLAALPPTFAADIRVGGIGGNTRSNRLADRGMARDAVAVKGAARPDVL